jgi:hypothetical protein
VEQLATDQASLKAAAGLAKPGKWSGVGASHDAALIWGECAGSGANPFRVMADLRDMGNKSLLRSRRRLRANLERCPGCDRADRRALAGMSIAVRVVHRARRGADQAFSAKRRQCSR